MKEKIKKIVESYRTSDDKRPIFIDFQWYENISTFCQTYYLLPKISVFEIGRKNRELPTIADIYEFFDTCEEKECIVTGLGAFLKLLGKQEFNKCVHTLLGSTFCTKFIVLTMQCDSLYEETVPKYKENIIKVEGKKSEQSSFVFIDPSIKTEDIVCEGLGDALKKYDNSCDENIYVHTKYVKENYPNSLIKISNCSSSYDVLCLNNKKLSKLSFKYGNEGQWGLLFEKCQNKSVDDLFKSMFDFDNVIQEVYEWQDKTDTERWILFIYLKYKNKKTGNWSVDFAMEKSKNEKEFISNIYSSILEVDHRQDDYWPRYEVWKKDTKNINDDTALFEYCRYMQYKGKDALYYLTDNTDEEKRLAISIISKYGVEIDKISLNKILVHTYSDLYYYLSPSKMGDDFLNNYFDEYKYLKVINTITPEFKDKVDKEAVDRSFKRRLKHRSEILDDISYENACVYFIDALGAEFLSYIENKCLEKDLVIKKHICQANLPTITSKNTEFREYFLNRNIEIKDEKRLDNLKHDGKDDYDFDKNKLPIHLVEELNIINQCLDEIKKKIKSETIGKAIIISDHGATRLAILNDEMIREDVDSCGEHGGRVCKQIPNMREIPNAIIEDGYCILCDYNAIKGGRVGKVEMHGGATLEEITVPLIEIYNKTNVVKIKVLNNVIKVSFKKDGVLKFYSNTKINNVYLSINGKRYEVDVEGDNYYSAKLTNLQKSGSYSFEVWSDNQLISTDNEFTIEKEVASSNDLWG